MEHSVFRLVLRFRLCYTCGSRLRLRFHVEHPAPVGLPVTRKAAASFDFPHVYGGTPALPSDQTAFVVYTRPNAEGYTAGFLKQFGFEFYYPKVRVTITHARKKIEAIRPFFPRYVFVYDRGDGVHFLRDVPGISAFLRRGCDVIRVGQSVIDKVREREDEFGFVKLDEPLPAPRLMYDADERIRWKQHGVEFDAIFQCTSGEGRASILVNLFGRTTNTEVNLEDIRKLTTYEAKIAFPSWLSRQQRHRTPSPSVSGSTGSDRSGESVEPCLEAVA